MKDVLNKIIKDSIEYYKHEKNRVVYNIHFGKNGMGLTDELVKIGKKVEEISKKNHVYITNSFIDTIDDVYDLTFDIYPREKSDEKNLKKNFEKLKKEICEDNPDVEIEKIENGIIYYEEKKYRENPYDSYEPYKYKLYFEEPISKKTKYSLRACNGAKNIIDFLVSVSVNEYC